MNIKKLTQSELHNLKNEVENLRNYLNVSIGTNSAYSTVEHHFLNLLNNKNFNNKTDLSSYCKTVPEPIDSISKELHKFFSNYNKKNNHYVQSALLKKIIKSSNNLLYFNYSYFYKIFRGKANINNSEEFYILKDLKNNYSIGIDKYSDYLVKNIKHTVKPISLVDQPQTYFINNYTEDMIKTGQIESSFMEGLSNKSLSCFDIIRYFSLHYSRSSNNFLSAIKALYVTLEKIDPISFNDYCIIQFFYHLVMVESYCNELDYFISNINHLNFSTKPIQSIIFSDTLSNTLKPRGYTGICISGNEILIIEKENNDNIFDSKYYLYDNFFNSQEFVCMSLSERTIFEYPVFKDYLKKSFYYSIFPTNIDDIDIHSVSDKFNIYLDAGYFLARFKKISQEFEI